MKQYTDETAGEKGGCSEAAIRAKERHGVMVLKGGKSCRLGKDEKKKKKGK